MRTLGEIQKDVTDMTYREIERNYDPLMLEIMCNVAITLDKIAKQGEPEIRIREDKQ